MSYLLDTRSNINFKKVYHLEYVIILSSHCLKIKIQL